MPTEDNSVHPFRVGFPEAELTELRRRVNATRWPERETVSDDSQAAEPPWPETTSSTTLRSTG
jgi:Epoxide hydrolase N terminus